MIVFVEYRITECEMFCQQGLYFIQCKSSDVSFGDSSECRNTVPRVIHMTVFIKGQVSGKSVCNINRIAEIRLNDKFGYEPVLGNQLWDWQEEISAFSDPGYADKGQLTVTYLTDAHRACAQRLLLELRQP